MSGFPPNSSGTYNFAPAIAEFALEAYERIQIFPPAIEDQHIISCRRSVNILLNDWSGNRGCNLWKIGDDLLTIPLVPGQATYQLPYNVVYILDTYLRQYTPNTSYTELGNELTAITLANGQPMLEATGEPMILAPSSGVFSTVQGSTQATMVWPFHGLSSGSPVFFQTPVTIGPMSIGGPAGFVSVNHVIDQNTISISLPIPAPATRNGVGGTPLLVTIAGSSLVNVVLAGHGLSVASQFVVQIPTVVGGLTLSGTYTVTAVSTPYEFTIQASGVATSGASAFENQGEILATSQASGSQFTDTLLWPVSRNDYAAFPNKFVQGRPSVYWFDRAVSPTLTVWATAQANSTWAVVCYRMIEIQDANPSMSQQLDMPRRAYPALVAGLTAMLAEKYRPAVFAEKMALAEAAWQRFAVADREMVSTYIMPQFSGYFR